MKNDELLKLLNDLKEKAISAIEASEQDYFRAYKEKFEKNIVRVSNSFSGSWIGYHANIYYLNFEIPISGDHFSPEWGFFMDHDPSMTGWREITYEQVKKELTKVIDKEYEQRLNDITKEATNQLEYNKDQLMVILRG